MNLNHILERGVRDYLRKEYPHGLPRQSFGRHKKGTILSSFDGGTEDVGKITKPFTLVRTGEAEVFIPNSENYKVDLAVSFISHCGDNSSDQHAQWAGDLVTCMKKLEWIDYLEDNNLVQIYTPIEGKAESLDIEDDHWTTTIGFYFACFLL